MKTDNEKTKNLIDCYSPVLYGDIDLMKKHMLDLSESWKEKEKAFKTAIRFVVNNDDEIDESNIGELAETLLQAIENRMPKSCEDCKKWYVVRRENKPKLLCTWCRVGMHDCNQASCVEEISGMRWFCKECNELYKNQMLPLMRKSKNNWFEGFGKKVEEINREEISHEEKDLNNKDKNDDKKDEEKNKERERIEKEKEDNVEETNKKDTKRVLVLGKQKM